MRVFAILLVAGSCFAQQIDWNTQVYNKPTIPTIPVPVNQGGTGVTTAQGNGSKVQLSTGTTTTNHCVKYDANGNTVDAGQACGTGGGAGVTLDLPSNYTFSQTPGGSLTSGTPATVTLTPCPVGVNGTDTAHYLYVSAGTGTAEAVLITGGTCTSGAGTGTVTFTPANNHTGAWTISSASCGLAELAIGSTYGAFIPTGTCNVYATVTFPVGFAGIYGAGPRSQVTLNFTSGDGFDFVSGSYETLSHFWLTPAADMSSGCLINGVNSNLTVIDMDVAGNNAAAYDGICRNVGNVFIDAVTLVANHYGVKAVNQGGSSILYIHDLHVRSDKNDTNYLSGSAVIYLQNGDYIDISNLIHLDGTLENGIVADTSDTNPVGQVHIVNAYLDHYARRGIYVIAGGTTHDWTITNLQMKENTTNVANKYGIAADSGSVNWQISNCYIAFQYIGMYFPGSNHIAINNCRVYPTNSATTGTAISIPNVAGASDFQITGNELGIGPDMGATPSAYGFYNQFGSLANLSISGNTLAGGNAALGLQGTETGISVGNNAGVDTVIPTVASGTTITAPVTPYARTFNISGTTTVTTINGGWVGREIRLRKSDAGSVTIGGGGNIPGSHTLAQYGNIILTYDGTNWE